MKPLAALLLLFACAGIAACGDDESGASVPPTILDVPWLLRDSTPSATFAHDHVAGFGGCNRYSAPAEINGDTVLVGKVAATQMACQGAAAAVEKEFLAKLQRAERWRVTGDVLTLSDADDRELLRFGVPSVEGTWEVTSFLQGDAVTGPPPGTTLTVTFGQDGRIDATAGCNAVVGTYRTDRGSMDIEGLSTTAVKCGGEEDAMQQEDALAAVLPLTAGYRVEGDSLSLLTADGTFVATLTR
ncbi:MAG: META domain-containing protein [Solirubrobacteraceae bacterium]|nr:META domain-containing protein [Solirubrobacteraceae bacterium]